MNWVQHQGKVSSPNTNTNTSVIVSSIRNKYKRQSTHTHNNINSPLFVNTVCVVRTMWEHQIWIRCAPVFRRHFVKYACMNTNVDALVLVFSFYIFYFFDFFHSLTLIRGVLQDIIFSHGVPALRTELFCKSCAKSKDVLTLFHEKNSIRNFTRWLQKSMKINLLWWIILF